MSKSAKVVLVSAPRFRCHLGGVDPKCYPPP
jgi:hypothetical protein